MIEALWSVEFETNLNMVGNGVVVFENGRMFGGDSAMIYIGSYDIAHDSVIHCKIKVDKFADYTVEMASSLGLDSFNLEVAGKIDPKKMDLIGHVVEDPSRKITIHAIHRAYLP